MEFVKPEAGIEMVRGGMGSHPRYPWASMEVGESFLVNVEKLQSARTMAYTNNHNKKYAPRKFRAGKDAAGNIRIWRVE